MFLQEPPRSRLLGEEKTNMLSWPCGRGAEARAADRCSHSRVPEADSAG